MASKQFKTYCKIIDYVDAVDPELASLMRGTCADMPLGSLKGKPGITFLMPQDKAFRAKLEKMAYSDKTEEATKAGDMLNALIIRDVFKSPSEWKSREVSNSLYPSQVVEVDSASAKEVVFKSGARAVLDENFKDSSRRSNLAVWKLVSGEIPVTDNKPAQNKNTKPRGKTGAYDPGNLQTQSERFKIALAVENAYALSRLQTESGSVGHQVRDVYLEHSLSLLNYILNVRNDSALLYEKILPLISFDKFDFYVLVEPHRASGQYLLDDMLIHEWWVQKSTHAFVPAKVKQDIEQMLAAGPKYGVYTNRAELLEKITNCRQRLGQIADSRPRSIVDEIAKFYDELDDTNTIGGSGPVYPPALAQYYAADKRLKMIQDELRYLSYGAFKRIEAAAFDYGAFHELTNMIGECLHAATADERARQHKLLNKNNLQYLISPSENVQEIKIFVYSTMFMFIPLTSSEANNLKYKNSIQRPNPSNIAVFNIAKDLYIQHQRLMTLGEGSANNMDLLAALRSLNVDNLDPALKAELQKKFSA